MSGDTLGMAAAADSEGHEGIPFRKGLRCAELSLHWMDSNSSRPAISTCKIDLTNVDGRRPDMIPYG